MSYACEHPIFLHLSIPVTDKVNPVTGKYALYKRVPSFVRCGKCYGCRKLKARQLASRMYHHHLGLRELYGDGYHPFFVTLSYSELENNCGKEHYTDIQKFFKRLRAKGLKFSYFVVNEFGSKTERLHFHAIIFVTNVSHIPLNDSLPNYYIGKKCRRLATLLERSADAYFRSSWQHGLTQTGSAANGSFVYLTKYILKQAVDENFKTFYRFSQKFGYNYYKHHSNEIHIGFEFGSGYPRVPAPRAAVKLCVPDLERRLSFINNSEHFLFHEKNKKCL